jgi:hypothetical protein
MTASNRQMRWGSYALIVLAGQACALFLGKDLGWDSLAYHLYSGLSATENRFGVDYFAASTQGYLNPYAHLPFYLMLKHGAAPQLVVATLALFHLLNLLIVFEIGVLLNRRADGRVTWLAVGLGVLLAFLNPVFILELGTSLNEISTSVPVLAGWYLLVREFATQRRRWIAFAGILLGIAAALKLSNLIFTVTALPLLLMAPASWKVRLQSVLVFAAGGLSGSLLGGGWWAWQLWEAFGNPLFPLFNQYFQSRDFVTTPIQHQRFMPQDWLDAVLRPFMMALPKRGVHVETEAPDLRYAALLLLLCLFGLKMALRRWRESDPVAPFQGGRALSALTLSLVLAWAAWLASSGNSRYFLSMACLSGLVLASLLVRFSVGRRFPVYSIVALLALQAGTVGSSAAHRWDPAGWGKTWFEIDVPAPLRAQPNLYLHVGTLPASFLLPWLPTGSGMINLGGQYPLVENAKIRALLDKHQGQVRVMRRAKTDALPRAAEFNYALIPLGLEADLDSCETIVYLHRGRPPAADKHMYYASCKTRPLRWSAAQLQDYTVKKRRAENVFNRLELVCPQYFQPRGLPIEGDGVRFWRVYLNTDFMVRQFEDGHVDYRNDLTYVAGELGHIDALERAMSARAQVCP